MTQHTPKPDAQFPSLIPPASPHSETDKQVPKVKSSLPDVHWALGNETTESNDNCPERNMIKNDKYSESVI